MSNIMVHWRYRSFSFNHDLLWKNSCWNKTPPNFFPCWIVLGHFQPFMILWKVIWTRPYLNQYTKSVFQNIPFFVDYEYVRDNFTFTKLTKKNRRNPGSKTNLNLVSLNFALGHFDTLDRISPPFSCSFGAFLHSEKFQTFLRVFLAGITGCEICEHQHSSCAFPKKFEPFIWRNKHNSP